MEVTTSLVTINNCTNKVKWRAVHKLAKTQLYMKITAVYENDSYIRKWQLYTKMTNVYKNDGENDICVWKWQLYTKMTAIYEKDRENESCIWKWQLYMKMTAVYEIYTVYIGCKVIELVLLSLSPFERFATNNNCK